jgi:hypothetical protein
MMKKNGLFPGVSFVLACLMSASALAAPAEKAAPASTKVEDFKGTPLDSEFTLGGMAGVGQVSDNAGFTIYGTAAKKIVHHGFVPDINNQVFLEAAVGPWLKPGSSAFIYSLHLRWDFQKDSEWTLYSITGLGGYFTGQSMGNSTVLYPRFGAGAFWRIDTGLKIRMEISHEFIGVGVSFHL